MGFILVGVLLAAELLTGAGGRDLTAVALASARPIECRPSGRAAADFWHRARAPDLAGYCNLLGRGYSRLGSDPRGALEAARAAELVRPGRAATSVLRGRAKLELGDPQGAWREFEQAKVRDPAALTDPAALRDLGLAALATGHRDEARRAYRKLVPRASLLESAAERQRVYLEAAMLAMGDGAQGLGEAIGLLTSARREQAAPGFSRLVTAALALALDRQGQVERARTLAAELEGPEALERWVRGGDGAAARIRPAHPDLHVVLPPGELPALAAIAAERTEPERALEEWRACVVAAPAGPWVGHARAKIAAFSAKVGARR
jgi:tetratricopeptide (TPR) repeat protein